MKKEEGVVIADAEVQQNKETYVLLGRFFMKKNINSTLCRTL